MESPPAWTCGAVVVKPRRAATLSLRPVRARVERDGLAPAACRRQLADDSLRDVGHRGNQLAIVGGGRTSGCTREGRSVRGRGWGGVVGPRSALKTCFLSQVWEARNDAEGSSRISSTRNCGSNLRSKVAVGDFCQACL